MIHICYITGLYGRYDSLMFVRQGISMVKAGHKVSFVVCDEDPNEIKEGISIYSTGFVAKTRTERFKKTKRVILPIADKLDADVYQISDPELIGLVRHFKNRRKVVVFNMREYYPEMLMRKTYIPRYLRQIASSFYVFLMKRNLCKYDAVFTVTPWIVDNLKDQFKLKQVFLLTNFPVVNKDYTLTKDAYLSRIDTVLYEGTIYVESRQEVFFDALERIPNVKYLIAGRIDEGNSCIKSHPYWKKVSFIDGFKTEELKLLFARSTISNTLRDFGGFDGSFGILKIFESMEAALPVVLSDVPLYRSLVEKYNCGVLANPNDVDSVEKAVRYLVENKETAYEMGQNGRKAVIEEYNWDEQIKIYQKVILDRIKQVTDE